MFGDTVAFGSSDHAVQGIIDVFVNSTQAGNFHGVGEFIGAVDAKQLAREPLDGLVSPMTTQILANIRNESVQVIDQPQAHTFGGQNSGQITFTNLGYIAVPHSEKQLLVGVVLSNDTNADKEVMAGILETIHIPSESGGTIPATAVPAASQTVRSSDQRVSLIIPGDWVALDHIADQTILAYGDSAAAQSRLCSAKPGLAPQTAISGNGGLIILYPMSQFNIDPQNPDLSVLMRRALGNLQGYTVEQTAQTLDGKALVAVIVGTERGYLALLPFGDQIVYVTAMGTQASFSANQAMLLDIVKSVHVPAVIAGNGLGGLEATPVATSAGLGGL